MGAEAAFSQAFDLADARETLTRELELG